MTLIYAEDDYQRVWAAGTSDDLDANKSADRGQAHSASESGFT